MTETLTQSASTWPNPETWTGKIYDGTWITPASGQIMTVTGPLEDGTATAVVGLASPEDVAAASARAAATQRDWEEVGVADKAAIFHKAAEAAQRHAADITSWIQREVGAVSAMAGVEIGYGTEIINQAASLVAAPRGEVLPPIKPGQFSYARRAPLGVVGVIGPWNAPFMLGLRSLAPALALGNAVVLKPAPATPISGGAAIAQLFEEAGLPPGLLQVVPGDVEAGDALVRDPNVASISFTGSTKVGREVGRVAGEHFKRVQLELGGNNAFIVLDDADFEAAIATGLACSILGNGQGCLCIGRHLVHESLVDRYTTEIARRAADVHPADPRQPGVFLGPVINQRQVDHLTRVVDETVAAGAKVLTGGKPDGQFFPPTVLTNVDRSMPAFAEEVFGPVISIVPFSSDAEAVEIANDTEYGLTAAIFSRNTSRAQTIAKRLNVNKIHINDVTALATAWAPLSGRGASGNAAAFGGTSDLEAYTQWQWVTVSNEADVPGAFAL